MKKFNFVLTSVFFSSMASMAVANTCPKPDDITLSSKTQEWVAPGGWSGPATYTDHKPKFFVAAEADSDKDGKLIFGNCVYKTITGDAIYLLNPYAIFNIELDPNGNWQQAPNNAFVCSPDKNHIVAVDSCSFEFHKKDDI